MNRDIVLATQIDDLTDDLLSDILYRLPNCPESATRCKTVCKRWLAVVDNASFAPGFARRQEEMNRKLLGGFIAQYDDPRNGETVRAVIWGSKGEATTLEASVPLSLSFLPLTPESKIRVLAVRRDLLLCCSVKNGIKDHSIYYICNPVTKKWSHLETPRVLQHPHTMCIWTSFVKFDSNGFTIAVMYKSLYVREKRIDVETFSSMGGAWTHSYIMLPEGVWHPRAYPSEGAFVPCNGKLHYTTNYKANLNVVALSLEPQAQGECNLRLIQIPHDNEDNDNNNVHLYSLGVCGGRLRISKFQGFFTFSIWDLEDYEKGAWKCTHKVNLTLFSFPSQHPSAAAVAAEACYVDCFHPSDKDIVYIRYRFPYFYKYVLCDMRAKTLKFSVEDEIGWRFHTCFSIELPWWPTPVPRVSQFSLV